MSGRSEEVWDYLAKRRNLIEGVVFTGGEPTLHECVPQIMREAGNMGYKTLLDTNGLLPDVIERCSPDYLALDIKTEPSLYASLLGAQYPDVEQRLSHALDIVRRMGAHAEVRITVAPGIVTEERVRNLRPLLQGVEKVFLQPLSLKNMVLNPEFFETLPMYPSEMVVLFQQILAPVVGKCSIRNQ
jgi:pyruvate formate lyase activating enzyme